MFKEKLNKLSDEALRYVGPGDFESDDLVNALIILQHVALSIAWRHQNDLGWSGEQRSLMAAEFGANLRQSITLFTGIDPADAVRGDSWPEVVT